jgi:hypothetical protein
VLPSHEDGSQSPLVAADETISFHRIDTLAVRRLCYLIGLALSLWAIIFSEQALTRLLQEDKDQSLSVPPSHNWTKMESWLCPGRVPNLTAAVTTFRLAQQVFLKRNERFSNSSDVPTFPYDNHIKEYFSFWPGHMLLRERESNKTTVFLRTYKCGSETIETYFHNQLASLGQVEARIGWNEFLQSKGQDSDCICSSYRDPMDHFFSGLGELEMRRTKQIDAGRMPDKQLASYELLHILSVERLEGFVESLFQGEWFKRAQTNGTQVPYHWLDFGHVFPQSGYLVWLHRVNRTVSTYIHLANLTSTLPTLLEENCGLPNGLPPVQTIKLHDKVPGLSNVHKTFWANGSATALSGTSRLPIIHALCLFHAMDYACLAPLLKVPPPEVCAEAFVKYLLV